VLVGKGRVGKKKKKESLEGRKKRVGNALTGIGKQKDVTFQGVTKGEGSEIWEKNGQSLIHSK